MCENQNNEKMDPVFLQPEPTTVYFKEIMFERWMCMFSAIWLIEQTRHYRTSKWAIGKNIYNLLSIHFLFCIPLICPFIPDIEIYFADVNVSKVLAADLYPLTLYTLSCLQAPDYVDCFWWNEFTRAHTCPHVPALTPDTFSDLTRMTTLYLVSNDFLNFTSTHWQLKPVIFMN